MKVFSEFFCLSIKGFGNHCFGSGSELDPDSIRSVDPTPNPDSEFGSGSRRAKVTHTNRKKLRNFMFWSAGYSLLRTKGFSCSLDVLYGGLGISELQFLIKKYLKCWIRIRTQWIRILNTASCVHIITDQDPGGQKNLRRIRIRLGNTGTCTNKLGIRVNLPATPAWRRSWCRPARGRPTRTPARQRSQSQNTCNSIIYFLFRWCHQKLSACGLESVSCGSDRNLSVVDRYLSVVDQHMSVVDQYMSVVERNLSLVDRNLSVVDRNLSIVDGNLSVVDRIEIYQLRIGSKSVSCR